jgi:hypothetical protein
MKKSIVLWIILIVQLFTLTACSKNPTITDKMIADKVAYVMEITDEVAEGVTLYEYIIEDEEYKKVFSFEGITIVGVNGLRNNWNMRKYWVPYNDNPLYSDGKLGEVTYNGKVYKSACVGIDEIIVKKGDTFIWYYRKY